MEIQYGNVLSTAAESVTIFRNGRVTRIGETLVRVSYPQLLSLITRLQEAAKDAARVPA